MTTRRWKMWRCACYGVWQLTCTGDDSGLLFVWGSTGSPFPNFCSRKQENWLGSRVSFSSDVCPIYVSLKYPLLQSCLNCFRGDVRRQRDSWCACVESLMVTRGWGLKGNLFAISESWWNPHMLKLKKQNHFKASQCNWPLSGLILWTFIEPIKGRASIFP